MTAVSCWRREVDLTVSGKVAGRTVITDWNY